MLFKIEAIDKEEQLAFLKKGITYKVHFTAIWFNGPFSELLPHFGLCFYTYGGHGNFPTFKSLTKINIKQRPIV